MKIVVEPAGWGANAHVQPYDGPADRIEFAGTKTKCKKYARILREEFGAIGAIARPRSTGGWVVIIEGEGE